MPAPPASTSSQKAAARVPHEISALPAQEDKDKVVRLHITPFTPALLKVYITPSVLPVAKNISYHTVETFPEKGFGFVELPAMEAQKLKKKLNGSTLKGSKVRIEEAKPEKRKKMEAERAEAEEEDRPAKRAKKERKKKEEGVLEGVELPDERKVKRGWTEVPVKGKKERKEKKDKDKEKDKDHKSKRKESKYTKEPELLFKAKLTPVAATEVARKEKKDKKKDKKEKKNNKSRQEVVVHEFEKNTKTPSFLKAPKVSSDAKPAVDYINDKGWVDEDGTVIEPETTKAKKRRVKELVEPAPEDKSSKSKSKSKTPAPATPTPTKAQKKKSKKATPPPESSSSESEESSVVSSDSESDSESESDSDSDSESESDSDSDSSTSPPTQTPLPKSATPEITLTPSSPSPTSKPIHPLEALFKKAPSTTTTPNPTSTPAKSLAPINTSFSFFDNAEMDIDEGDGAQTNGGVPFTPQTQRDIEFRGLRSAAPTPDTAAIGRRFSFPWRGGSEGIEEEDEEEVDEGLARNTRANEGRGETADAVGGAEIAAAEKDVDGGAEVDADGEEKVEEESEFRKWFWENQGGLNRGWKRRRREAVKGRRNAENRRVGGGVRRRE